MIVRTLIPSSLPPARSSAASLWAVRGICFVAVVLLLQQARPVLLPIAIAVVFGFVLAAPVRALRRFGVHEYVGAGIVIVAVLGVVVLLGMIVAAPAAAWWQRAPIIIGQLLDALQDWRDALFPYATPSALTRAPAAAPPGTTLAGQLASAGWNFTRLAIGETVAFAFSAAATVILLYFLLASEQRLVARTAAAIRRPRQRALVLSGLRQAERDIGLFIVTMSIVNVALGVATGIGLALIGLPNPVLWATTTVVLTFIPYLGPLLVAVLLLLAGSVTFGAGFTMLGPPAVFLALHGIEANFLSPMIMGHRLRLRPVFVFVAVMLMGWLWGIAGAFIAVPVLLGLRALCKRWRPLHLVCAYLEAD